MVLFIFGVALFILGVVGLLIFLRSPKTVERVTKDRYGDTTGTKSVPNKTRRIAAWSTAGLLFFGLTSTFFSSVYSQSVGEASVIVNAGGTIAGQNPDPGFAFKAPWQTRSPWDLFSQQVTFAGGGDKAPDYTGGTVSGQEITASVKGGAQANVDVQVVYSLDGNFVGELYPEYRSQERFTQQIIVPKILSVIRDTPSSATPVEFRGEKRGEIQDTMLERLNTSLSPYGVTVQQVAIQDIRFTEDVELSIKNVEVAQQKEAEAEANLRATEVSAQAQVVEAQAEADANRILSESLTPALLQQKWIDAIKESGGTIVIPDNAAPLINIPSTTP